MQKIIENIFSKLFLGSLLIGGTALGAAMLANPVATAGAGILPSYFVYFICWLFSVATGCLFIELASWLPKDANLLTMAQTFLGEWGKWSVLLVYVFQFFLILIAYMSLGGKLLIDAVCSHIPYLYGVLGYLVIFGGIVLAGTKASSRTNALLMVGLILTFLLFIIVAGEHASVDQAHYWGWKYAYLGLPVIFLSFSYQGTIPTLYNYLDQDAKKSRVAVFFGTLIPFFAYLLWDYLIKGIVPLDGAHGLLAAKQAGSSAVAPLEFAVADSRIYVMGKFFAFFALTTSFIGVSLAMIDFFADLFKVEAEKWNRFYLCLMIFIPVVTIVLINPQIFITALTLAGGFGSAILLGLLPIVLVWMGRKQKKYKKKPAYLLGGDLMLAVLLVALLAELAISVYALV